MTKKITKTISKKSTASKDATKPKFTKGKAKHNNKQSISSWLLITSIKLSIIFVVSIGLYSIYLDGKVRQKFEGQRWQIPAQVYAKIPEVIINEYLDLNQLERTLKAQNYTAVARVQKPGQFKLSGKQMVVYRRQFDFGFGVEEPSLIKIETRSGDVYKITQDDENVQQVYLEPMLIDRILSAEHEDRIYVSIDQLPQQLIDTLLLVEDKDFYNHHGVSPTSILRAFWKNVLAGARVQGGSTLTQQLAKNMFLNRAKTIWRKVNEALMAIILEIRYSKDQILEAYLNEVYLGQHYANGIYGFGLAAEFYFGKSLNQLENHEMALLVAQVKGPSFYDPWRKPERAFERRDLILRLMFEQQYLSKDEYQFALEKSLDIRSERRIAKQSFPAYMQLVRRELNQMGAGGALQAGIKVFTAFNFDKQVNAERALTEQLTALEKNDKSKDLQAAMIISDIRTGYIEAVVGGKDVKYSGFNRAIDSHRPIGSLIKPVVYLTALEHSTQFNLASPLADKAISLKSSNGKLWQPKNYDGKYRGSVPLIDGLVYSLNIPTVNLGLKLGLDSVSSTLYNLGYQKDIPMVPSMLLGSIDMSAFEVNEWYNTIANTGVYNKPRAIIQVTSAQGETLWHRALDREVRVSHKSVYLLEYAMQNVTTKGTAKSLTWRVPEKVLAGKTGTSNDLRDSWFVGYDQQSVVTTWVGRDDNKPMGLTGSSGALTIFAKYLQKQGAHSRYSSIPEGIEFATFELATGNAVSDECLNVGNFPAVSQGIFYSDQCLEKRPEPPSWLEKLFGLDGD